MPVRPDVTRLESKWWSTSIVGMVADPPQYKSYSDTPGMQLMKDLTSSECSPQASSKRKEATAILMGMLEFASHMNIPAVILPPVPLEEDMFNDKEVDVNGPSSKEYARLVNTIATSNICTTSHVQLWIRVALSIPHLRAATLMLERCNHPPVIGCMLYVNTLLDAASLPQMVRELHLFVGSGNVKALSCNVGIFLKNKKNFPALSKSHQFVFSLLFGRLGRTLRLLVEGNVGEPGVNVAPPSKGSQCLGQHGGGSSGRLHHLQYLRHLRSRLASKLDTEEAILETPYLDHLQSPLQPLGDHLEYQTYETFEKDPVKYKNYGLAIQYALEEGIEEGRFEYLGGAKLTGMELHEMVSRGSGREEEEDMDQDYEEEMVDVDVHRVTILVVGAGRGPLVKQAIQAVSRVSASWVHDTCNEPAKKIKALYANIIAVEKNPSAILYLKSLKHVDSSWNGGRGLKVLGVVAVGGQPNSIDDGKAIIPGTSNVTVVGCDMREAADSMLKYMVHSPSLRADLVVSELLGSFGDNELSPECLDGVQRCGILKDSCVSIPQRYVDHFCPKKRLFAVPYNTQSVNCFINYRATATHHS